VPGDPADPGHDTAAARVDRRGGRESPPVQTAIEQGATLRTGGKRIGPGAY